MENNKKRILICEFLHETNTFNPTLYTLDMFKAIRFAEGPEFYERATRTAEAVHGMIDVIEEMGGEVIPGISLLGWAGGRVSDDVLKLLFERTEYYIKNSGELDAVFVSCHGAVCTESEDDPTGLYLEHIRKLIGNDKIIAISCDLHANITKRMIKNVDIISGYICYPHTDIYETGCRAARLGMKKMNGDQVYMASVTIPMLVPPSGYSTQEMPFKAIKDYGVSLVEQGLLLDYSAFIVQAWMDLPEIGNCIITIAENEKAALKYADEIAERVFAIRDGMTPKLYRVDEIIDIAECSDTPKPVILVNSADSPNSGSIGDSVEVAARLLARKSNIRMGCCVKDDEVVDQAFKVGVGNYDEFNIGGKYTVGMTDRFIATGKVVSLHEGSFRAESSQYCNEQFDAGPVAVLNFGNIDIIVCKTPIATGDPQLFRHFGIEPTQYDLIEVKANASFREQYSAFTRQFYYADTYGASAPNLKRFHWEHLPSNMYPFDLENGYQLEKAKLCTR